MSVLLLLLPWCLWTIICTWGWLSQACFEWALVTRQCMLASWHCIFLPKSHHSQAPPHAVPHWDNLCEIHTYLYTSTSGYTIACILTSLLPHQWTSSRHPEPTRVRQTTHGKKLQTECPFKNLCFVAIRCGNRRLHACWYGDGALEM